MDSGLWGDCGRFFVYFGRSGQMFHYQVLKNADLLANEDPIRFCELVGMKISFKTEFRKMINLAEMIKEKGL